MKLTQSLVAVAAALTFTVPALAQTGTYTTYGQGCAGSAVVPGLVLPNGYATQFGNSANRFPFGSPNMRYMQVHDAAELPPTALVRGINLRNRSNYAIPAYQLTMDINVGYHTGSARSLNSSFASNWTGTPQQVFTGTYNVQAAAATTDPTIWPLKIAFSRPFIYTRARGNFLFEVVNTTATVSPYTYYSAASATTVQATRMWATTATASTGSTGPGYALTIQLVGANQNQLIQLSNTGVPKVNASFSVDISGSAPRLPALLWLGAQQLNIDLSAVLPGCSLYSSLDVLLGGIATDASGGGSMTLSIPNNNAFAGLRFYNQWMVADPNANGLGVALSGGGGAQIGR